jgi:hypothetical protein
MKHHPLPAPIAACALSAPAVATAHAAHTADAVITLPGAAVVREPMP